MTKLQWIKRVIKQQLDNWKFVHEPMTINIVFKETIANREKII